MAKFNNTGFRLVCFLTCIVLLLYAGQLWRSDIQPKIQVARLSGVDKGGRVNGNNKNISKESSKTPTIDIHNGLRDDITLVTAYFDLGAFFKVSRQRTPDHYTQWMLSFGKMVNPVVAYFDSEYYYQHFSEIRQTHPECNRTEVHKVDRNDLWSFSLSKNISKIYNDKDYPTFYPNTVNANYSCAMHAKYELVHKTILRNPFKTKYFAWIDIGLFRALEIHNESLFQLDLPQGFNENKIAYTEVFKFKQNAGDDTIFRKNQVWVCGCFFLGRVDKMAQWTTIYMNYTSYFLQHNLMNTDQQVIYAIFSNHAPKLQIQTFIRQDKNKYKYRWFYLGYKCKDDGKNYVMPISHTVSYT